MFHGRKQVWLGTHTFSTGAHIIKNDERYIKHSYLCCLKAKVSGVTDKHPFYELGPLLYIQMLPNQIILLYCYAYTLTKKVEWIRRIAFHRVAALSAFGIEVGNPFRDCIDSLLIDLEG